MTKINFVEMNYLRIKNESEIMNVIKGVEMVYYSFLANFVILVTRSQSAILRPLNGQNGSVINKSQMRFKLVSVLS